MQGKQVNNSHAQPQWSAVALVYASVSGTRMIESNRIDRLQWFERGKNRAAAKRLFPAGVDGIGVVGIAGLDKQRESLP